MSSTISEISAELQRVDLFVPFKVAYGATTVAELSIIQLKDDQGNVGLGEGAPPSYLSSEEKTRATDVARDLAERCKNKSPVDSLHYLKSIRQDVFESNPIAYVAVETALWDLRAKQQKVPLCEQLGGAKRRTVSTDITLPLLELSEVAPFWNLMQSHRFRIVKIKVSGNIAEDMDRIRELINVAPKGIQIFLDGNQGFDALRCHKLVEQIGKAGFPQPLFFEQPLPKDAWSDLKRLSDSLPIPVCLDETISSLADVQRCIRDKVAPMLNLKIMKSGIEETASIAKSAAQASMPMMIGGMVESEITMTASLHMMCAMPAIQYADLDTPFFLKERLCNNSAWHRDSSELILNEGYGLGLSLK